MASCAALKMAAAICVLAMCIGSQVVAVAAGASTPQQDAAGAGGALLRELMEHELAAELGLAGDAVGDVCTPACQTCLIVCAIKCVLKPSPAACYADCIVADSCFTLKTATV
uniref:Uncharacterized protein n=1 Tax=Oryza brachyantha TaxID=4533 RepID=J3MXI1_ORYBR